MSTFEKYAESTNDVLPENKLRAAIGMIDEDEMSTGLSVSRETLATWRTKKRGPPSVKIGKKVFYLLSSFTQWVTSEAEKQASAPKHKRSRRVTERRAISTLSEGANKNVGYPDLPREEAGAAS